jgi:hypothetical protein
MEISSFIRMNKIGVSPRLDKERGDIYMAVMISVGGEFNRYLFGFLSFFNFFPLNSLLK